MFKVALLTLAVFSAVLADTTFNEVPAGAKSAVVLQPGDVASHAEGYSARGAQTFTIPDDNGGNWGDNIWGKRQDGDKLIVRQIQVNEISNLETKFDWTANFPNKKITNVRILNIGRQRAYVETISASNGPQAAAVIRNRPNYQFRLLIEVYAK